MTLIFLFFFFFQAEDGIRDLTVTGVQTCALPILIELDHRFARAIGCTWKVQGNPRRRLDCKSGGVRRQRFGKLNAHDLGASLDGAGNRLYRGLRPGQGAQKPTADGDSPASLVQYSAMCAHHFLPSCNSSVLFLSIQSPLPSWTISRNWMDVSVIRVTLP